MVALVAACLCCFCVAAVRCAPCSVRVAGVAPCAWAEGARGRTRPGAPIGRAMPRPPARAGAGVAVACFSRLRFVAFLGVVWLFLTELEGLASDDALRESEAEGEQRPRTGYFLRQLLGKRGRKGKGKARNLPLRPVVLKDLTGISSRAADALGLTLKGTEQANVTVTFLAYKGSLTLPWVTDQTPMVELGGTERDARFAVAAIDVDAPPCRGGKPRLLWLASGAVGSDSGNVTYDTAEENVPFVPYVSPLPLCACHTVIFAAWHLTNAGAKVRLSRDPRDGKEALRVLKRSGSKLTHAVEASLCMPDNDDGFVSTIEGSAMVVDDPPVAGRSTAGWKPASVEPAALMGSRTRSVMLKGVGIIDVREDA